MAKPSTAKPTKSNQDPKSAPRALEVQNEGEGSRSAGRRYDAAAAHAASSPKRVEDLAKRAEKALGGPEGGELQKAQEQGKSGSHR